jgi:hypothetical protein
MKELTLAIDPGIASAWALISPDGALAGTGVWAVDEIPGRLDALIRRLHLSGYTLSCVVAGEKPGPTREMVIRGAILATLEEIYELHVQTVWPNEWRPPTRAVKCPWRYGGVPLTLDQKNAYKMALFARGLA